ncbi:MAG: nucleotidyltransferase domain-containing protein [Armatimonadota bacterium]|nr:MAG: nucleotidyltransferase domain-containing protein [Armatimonadota bacterium]
MADQAAVDQWLADFAHRLRETFGDRLLFVGHHGSWARGEAATDSDIDTMVIVDRIGDDDLAAFRAVVTAMPEGGRSASGLFNSAAEVRARPPSELLQYFWGCRPLHGGMDGIVARPTGSQLLEDVRRKASDNLLNARHYLLYPHDLRQKVHGLRYPFKECFYALQEWLLAERGTFYARKEDLLDALADADDRAVVEVARDWPQSEADRNARPEHYVGLLERWSRRALERLGAAARTGPGT